MEGFSKCKLPHITAQTNRLQSKIRPMLKNIPQKPQSISNLIFSLFQSMQIISQVIFIIQFPQNILRYHKQNHKLVMNVQIT